MVEPIYPLSTYKRHYVAAPLLLFVFLVVLWSFGQAPLPQSGSQAMEKWGQLPLFFVPNEGQHPSTVQFAGGGLFFAHNEVIIGDTAVRLQFIEAEATPEVVGRQDLPGAINYLLGIDEAQWLTNLTAYQQIQYQTLYRGIDLIYEGKEGQLKSTYFVQPGANPEQIRWRYAGAQRTELASRSGDLQIYPAASGSMLVEQAPIAWQDLPQGCVPVDVEYMLHANGEVSFDIGAYDPTITLIIDPLLIYSTLIGGSEGEEGRAVAVDASGNVYVVGATLSSDFPETGPPQATYGGPTDVTTTFGDAFILKLNPSGEELVYATYLGGNGVDIGDAIALLPDGSVIISGMTESPNFPTTAGVVQPSPGGNNCQQLPCADAFVTKLNAAGNDLVFSTYLGGSREENSSLWRSGVLWMDNRAGLAVDTAGQVYVSGTTNSTDFPLQNAAFTQGDTGGNLFVSKLSADGKTLLYSSYLGGSKGEEYNGGLALQADSTAVLVGSTLSEDFPTRNAYQNSYAGQGDVIIARFDTTASGNSSYLYGSYYGAEDTEYALDVAIDEADNIFFAGHTQSANLPTANAFQDKNASAEAGKPIPRDAFVAQMNPTASQLLYGSYFGGTDADGFYSIDVNLAGDLFLVGITSSTDLPVREAWQAAKESVIESDMMLVRLNTAASGNSSLIYSSYLGGLLNDYAYGTAVGQMDSQYLTGEASGLSGAKFPLTNTIGPDPQGDNALVAKFNARLERIFLPLIVR